MPVSVRMIAGGSDSSFLVLAYQRYSTGYYFKAYFQLLSKVLASNWFPNCKHEMQNIGRSVPNIQLSVQLS